LAILKLFKIRKECKIDVIHSVSAPYCSHIVGFIAKTILKKPWVCHLDDFWADQSAEHFDRYRFINRWIEKKCLEKADVVLSTSREILSLAAARYPEVIRKKFTFVPPSYESSHYPRRGFASDGKFRFTYLGVLYPGKREPASLFEALRIVRERHPQTYSRIEVYLVGVDHNTYQSMAERLGIGDVVKCSGRVDYLESMKLMKEASVLVHIGYLSGKFSEDIHISGKLFEYLGAERLMLAITSLSGPVADFIRENNGIVSDYNNPNDIADALVKIVSHYSIDDLYNWKNPSHVQKLYSSESVASVYKELFQRLISNAQRT
jgi:glycosyltransferase involved in cell wall biosynthesis